MKKLSYFVAFAGLLCVVFLQDLGPFSKHRVDVLIEKANATAVYEFLADYSSNLPVLHPTVTEVKIVEKRNNFSVYEATEYVWPCLWITMKVFSHRDAEKLSINNSIPSAALGLHLSSLTVIKQDNKDVLVTEHLGLAMPLWYDWLLGKVIRSFAVDVHQKLSNNLKAHFETKQMKNEK